MSKIINISVLGFPWPTKDPFLFCAYHKDNYPQGDANSRIHSNELIGRNMGSDFEIRNGFRMYHGATMPGFPYHPHRGFETITINKEGVVDHTDSLGGAGRFMEGDVQWMTAGRGLQHSEMFPLVKQDSRNPLEIFQVWLNLPKASKFVDPHYKMLWKEEVPTITHINDNGSTTVIDVIAGHINDTKAVDPTPNSWAADKNNAVGIFTIRMSPNATWTLPKTDGEADRTMYYYKGDTIDIDGDEIRRNRMIELVSDEDITITNGDETSYFLILEGKPINEPVFKHGPFVMNTRDEILEAMREYGLTQFGGWPWEEREVAHHGRGRFAKYTDGTEEVKD